MRNFKICFNEMGINKNAFVGGYRRSPTQALISLEARVTSDRRKHTEK